MARFIHFVVTHMAVLGQAYSHNDLARSKNYYSASKANFTILAPIRKDMILFSCGFLCTT